MRLAGKVAVVTGGGSGIGRGIVLALAREGADIAIPDIQVLNAEKVAGEVKGLGRKVLRIVPWGISPTAGVVSPMRWGPRARGGTWTAYTRWVRASSCTPYMSTSV